VHDRLPLLDMFGPHTSLTCKQDSTSQHDSLLSHWSSMTVKLTRPQPSQAAGLL